MDRMNIERSSRRYQDRRQDQNRGVGFHEAAHKQQKQINHQQEHIFVAADAQEKFQRHFRNHEFGQHVAVQSRRSYHQHDGGGLTADFLKYLGQVFQPHFSVNYAYQDHSIQRRHCSGFRRRKRAG